MIIERQRRGNRFRHITGTSMQRLPSLILLPTWRMTGRRVSENSLRPMMCQLKRFMPLFTRIWSSWRGRPGSCQICQMRIWRRSKWECMRRLWRWSPQLLDHTVWVSRRRVKKELAGLTLTQENFLKESGGMRNLTAADFTEMPRQWYYCCENCVTIIAAICRKTKKYKMANL